MTSGNNGNGTTSKLTLIVLTTVISSSLTLNASLIAGWFANGVSHRDLQQAIEQQDKLVTPRLNQQQESQREIMQKLERISNDMIKVKMALDISDGETAGSPGYTYKRKR